MLRNRSVYLSSLLVVTSAALSFIRPVREADLWWHIVVGRWILANDKLPQVDYWSLEKRGEPWIAYSWSTEVLFAWLDRLGNHALFFASIALAMLFALSLWRFYHRLVGSECVAALLAATVTLSLFSHFGLRPQTFTWMLYAAVLYVLMAMPNRRWLTPLSLFLIGAAWANLHLSALIGLGTILIVSVGSRGVSTILFGAFAFFVGTLITPYFGAEWLTLLAKSDHPIRFREIQEFHSPILMDYISAFPILLSGVWVVLVLEGRKLPPMGRLLALLITGIVAIAFLKFIPFYNILIGMLIVEALGERPQSDHGLTRAFNELERRYVAHSRFLFVCLAGLVGWQFWTVRQMSPFDLTALPVAETRWIRDRVPAGTTIVTDFSTGGFLLYALSNSRGEIVHRVSIDGRTNLISPEQWRLHLAAQFNRDDGLALLDYTGATVMLWAVNSPFLDKVERLPNWCRATDAPSVRYAVLEKRADCAMSFPN